jgi:hypothetical protein
MVMLATTFLISDSFYPVIEVYLHGNPYPPSKNYLLTIRP